MNKPFTQPRPMMPPKFNGTTRQTPSPFTRWLKSFAGFFFLACWLFLGFANPLLAQTELVKDIFLGPQYSFPSHFAKLGSNIFFKAQHNLYGTELWKSDGTEAGTVLVSDIRNGFASSDIYELTPFNSNLYFAANDGVNGRELWKTDGTLAGTVMVKDIYAGSTGSFPSNFIVLGGALYFVAENATNGAELWKTDGTSNGTVLVKDINPGSNGSAMQYLTLINNQIYFTANNGVNGGELWKTDGTSNGTVMVKDINVGSGFSNPLGFEILGNTVYFRADNGTNGSELWKSDGTANGTVLVKDIFPGNGGSNPDELTVFGTNLYFRATDGTNGSELWKTDGTSNGTVLIKDINIGAADSAPGNFTVLGNSLYFGAFGGTNDGQLWKTDGTSSGTVLFKNSTTNFGNEFVYPVVLNNNIYFSSFDDIYGYELWKTDGTVGGTAIVYDINPGTNDSSPGLLIVMGSNIYFSAYLQTTGIELWKSDGVVITGKSITISTAINPTNCTTPNGTIAFTSTGFASSIQTLSYSKDGTPTSTSVTVAADGTFTLTGLGAGSYTGFAFGATTATGTNPTLTSPALPTITLGTVTGVNTSATSFNIPYTGTTGSPNQYSLTAGSPAMPGFTPVSNTTLGASPISVTIPASAVNTYNFNLTVRNSTTGCVSAAVPVALTVTSGSATTSPKIAAGDVHSLMVKSDGTLWAWGYNNVGQLGIGNTTNQSCATQIGTGTTWTAVATGGGSHSLALRNDGTLWAWGNNDYGQLGIGNTTNQTSPVQVGTGTTWTAIAAGFWHSIALRSDGTLWAWGRNSNGQLGIGSITTQSTIPVQIGNATNWTAISTLHNHTLALQSNGTLWAWGINGNGQLGTGNTTQQTSPTQVGTGTTWSAIATGQTHSVALQSDGTLWAWGNNASGQLGIGNTIQQTSPTQIGTATNWMSIGLGQSHSLARRSDGTLWTWGYNVYGQLGIGNTTQQNSPVQVGNGTTWTTIAGGQGHSLALQSDGNVWAWGSNSFGQLGTGNTNTQLSAVQSTCNIPPTITTTGTLTAFLVCAGTVSAQQSFTVSGSNLTNNITVTAPAGFEVSTTSGSGFTNSITLTQSGGSVSNTTIYVRMSANATGTPAGNISCTSGTTTQNVAVSGTVNALPTLTLGTIPAINVGGTSFTLPYTSTTGSPTTYSISGAGITSVNNATLPSSPITVSLSSAATSSLIPFTLTVRNAAGCTSSNIIGNVTVIGGAANITKVVTGNGFSVMLKDDGTLWAWGDGYSGQLGNGTATFSSCATQVGTNADWSDVSAGGSHVLALKSNGTLWAWGSNSDGRLGLGNTTNQNTPQQVGTATNWYLISANRFHSMAIKTDGTLWAWGGNGYGQLGLGNYTNQNTPVQVGTATNWATISSGEYHTMAIKTDGTLWAWGSNQSGQLGIGSTTPFQNIPIQVGSGTVWSAVASGVIHSMALQNNGTLWAWGSNSLGELGLGNTTQQNSPQQVGVETNWRSISAGDKYSLAVKTNNTLWSWGNNQYGQLGLGTSGTGTEQTTPQQVAGTTWKTVSAGSLHTTSLKTDGELWTWGYNYRGGLGIGNTTQQNSPVRSVCPPTISSFTPNAGCVGSTITITGTRLTGATAVSIGGTAVSSFTVNSDTQITVIVGSGTTGTISVITPNGTATSANSFTVNALPTLTLGTIPAINVGGTSFTLPYIATTGSPTTYSISGTGITAINNAALPSSPIMVNLNSAATSNFIPFTLTVRNAAGCTSSNIAGNVYVIGGIANITKIATGSEFTVVLKSDSTLWAWGNGNSGQMGNGTNTNTNTCAIPVGSAKDWVDVAAGGSHILAVKKNGTLWAWGGNSYGQLGLGNSGTGTNRNTPIQVDTATSWKAVAAGRFHSMAIKTNGTLWIWGYNTHGQLGQGDYTHRSTPTQVGPATDWKTTVGGESFTLALKTNGALWSWGANGLGQLGIGSTTISFQPTPVQVGTDTSWSAISVGSSHALALRTNGTLWAWGYNFYGQLGLGDNGTGTNRNSPQQLGTENNWKEISVSLGGSSSYALKTNNTLWSWGENTYGQLGIGSTTNQNTPQQIAGTNWKTVSAGTVDVMARKTDEQLWGWGRNAFGGLSIGNTSLQNSPVQSVCSPTISSFTPNSGCVGSTVTITGSRFTGVTAVRIGGTAVSSFTINSDTQITAVVGNGTTGTISLITPSGTATSANTFTVNALPTVSATGASVCQGNVLSLSSSGSASTYTWTGPNGFSSTVQNPTVSSSATSAMAGVYTVRVTNANNCTATATANVTVISISSTNANGATVCAGANLSVSASGGTNYSWTGPNGFTSTLQNPVISSSATASMTGIYTVLISACSVTTTSTVSVTVNPNPSASATGATVCAGTSLSISASGGTSYLWTGPNGFSSTIQNPTVSSGATSAMGGIYTVRVTNATNCTATTTANVTVNSNPTASATGATVCAGTSLAISASGGTSYLWTGPNGFSSTVQNPTVSSSATSAMAGVYTVRVTNATNCTATATTSVTVSSSPAVSATCATVCAGTNLSISASGGTSYLWSGPNGFSSTVQNPTISSSATSAMGGIYTVRVTIANNCTTTVTASVTVNSSPTPSATGATACIGTSLAISASGGTNYRWTGPNGFSSTIQNPTISSGATSAMTGIYTVRVTNASECSATATASVTVNSNPTPSATGTTVCSGTNLSISASGGTSYLWSGPNGFSSTVQNPTVSSSATSAMEGIYTVLVTNANNCTATTTASVTVKSSPSAYITSATVCTGSFLTISVTNGGTSYLWTGPNGFSSTVHNPIVSTSATTAMAGVYTVRVTSANNCTTTNTANVTVNSSPTASATGATVCAGTSLAISASGGASYNWTGPNGFSSTIQNPTISSSATSAMGGIYTVWVTNASNCFATTTARVTVNVTPTITIEQIPDIYTSNTRFSILYTATGNPDQYSLVAGSPALLGFTTITNGTLSNGTINVPIPASSANTYNFSLTVRNSTSGCGNSAAVPVALTVTTAPASNLFITRWDLSKPGGANTSNTSISFSADYNVSYTWKQVGGSATGSGTTTSSIVNITNLPANGIIDLSLTPTNLSSFKFLNSGEDAQRLIQVRQWGSVNWSYMVRMFDGCSNMILTATDVPNTTNANLTSMGGMFKGCSKFNQPITLNTSNVTSMSGMFEGCTNFNQSLSGFNTANVTDMSYMFSGCTNFNQSVSNFNTANVTNMTAMFRFCDNFNQSVSNFNTTKVISMGQMFNGCSKFNQSVSNFNTANVISMDYMFAYCRVFNQPLSNFNTAKVTNMRSMFFRCDVFNQPLSSFNTANVTDMRTMFAGCDVFNQALSNFNTANVTDMSYMFESCEVFNQALSSFNTANVTDMQFMFYKCSAYNQALPSTFNTAKVTNMKYMFAECKVYNQALPSSFNTANVTDMSYMFDGCSAYNQALPSSFNTIKVTNMAGMFSNCFAFNQALPSSFNTAAVTNMGYMFYGCSAYNQALPSSFNTAAVTKMDGMFYYSAFNQSLAAFQLNPNVTMDRFLDECDMSVANYDATLKAFNAQNITGRVMGATGLKYCASAAERANLVKPVNQGGKGWIIQYNADGPSTSCYPVISSTSLTSACEGSTITITGQNFTGATAVSIGANAVGSFSVINDTQISATVISGNIGTISVTTPPGTGTSIATFTTNDYPSIPTISGPTEICIGQATSLMASSSFPKNSNGEITFTWTDNLTGWNIQPAPLSTRSYRVMASSNGCAASDSSAAYTVTVNPKPANPSIVPSSITICKGQTVQLTGTCSTANASFRWTTPPFNLNSALPASNVRSVTEPGVYKGLCESDKGCFSDEVSVRITQNCNCSGQNFITITPEKPAICAGTPITMTASGCTGTLTWTGGATPISGSTVSLSPAATTNYTVNCSTGGSGTFTLVVVSNTLAVAADILTGKERFRAATTLTSNKKVGDATITPGANVIYEAGGSITLLPGFAVEQWSTFKAEIKGCNQN